MKSRRLDQILTEKGLAPSRTKAQSLIDAGDVEIFESGEWKTATQASKKIEAQSVRLKGAPEILKYVSRGGLKLEGALKHLGLDVTGFRVLDLGVSTGGFADCLLKSGAREVLGVDVGHGQLDPRIKIAHFEGVNVKEIAHHRAILDWIGQGVDLCVADLSFISTLSLAPHLRAFLPAQTKLLALIKPQFELGREALDKAGVVADPGLYAGLGRRTLEIFPGQFFPSAVKGQDGNQEFFVYSQMT